MTDAYITDLLFVRDPLTHSDLALVFGHHEPGVSALRVAHAASLFLAGYTPLLLLSGGATDGTGRSEAERMAAVARDRGVPDDALLLETGSRTTAENLAHSVSLLSRKNLLPSIRTAHLVSCPWHMQRVSHLAEAAFGPSVRLVCSPHEADCTASSWVSSAECRARVLTELRLVRHLVGC